ncbi:beta-ketoacyl synthase [Desulfovibrio sp. JC010]|uniref:beta-ketoacyl-[acyl-carrier-protein] synthase family protein n=1 Tax=Desulfovibrio sp. JC010 TaxID=2593641 RepID=UPI0013D7B4B8|nr:beta-ketoacyl-[acyl-carrier-protein] synthase family protein [Desulfovibrio sp. JC010]NDV26725.1 beta-ketoacyl-[acyl-carrier-protein] synthase family protein [Desulfovibrio sp. JC010]
MHLQRVVITGMGAISPLGSGVKKLWNGLVAGRSGISRMEELDAVKGLRPRIAGRVPEVNAKAIPRKARRTMSNLSIFAALAALEAIEQSGIDEATLSGGRTGLSVGSTTGSSQALEQFFKLYLPENSLEAIKSTEFFKIMNHSAAANLSQFLNISGRVIAASAACSTGCQNIGLAAEAVAAGKQDVMLCGGTDELHPLTVGTFDIIEAASTSGEDDPATASRPFDAERDGIVCSEGAGILLLESYEHATARGAEILAEISGFSSLCDSSNMASPSADAIALSMSEALKDAGISGTDIDYVNAHATGTLQGDASEAQAVADLLGGKPPVSSLKGHLGHTMAASGAIETIATIRMMQESTIIPTANLRNPAEECSVLNNALHLQKRPITYALKNNFALGGINTSLVLRRA